ncbi:hypothetical protein, partial [Catenovulum agarivorans]|uniref:hypothetical protein n=1 Tax=Catenovulum agarivorans TaxID=1172192 RepID=UPI001ED955E1
IKPSHKKPSCLMVAWLFVTGSMNFHQTKRAVKTPSTEQVRQPFYKDRLEQWKNYESELEIINLN